MDAKFGFIFVIIVASYRIIFVSGLDIKLGTFHNLHQHTELKSCADEVLKENLCVGGKVQELTGGCECLRHSWGINQTIQGGYAYTKKVSVEEIFRPPVTFNERKAASWILPGVLREGAKVELTISSDARRLSIVLVATLDEIGQYFQHHYNRVSIRYDQGRLDSFSEFDGSRNLYLQSDDKMFHLNLTKTEKTKISFLALSGSVRVLVDDQTIVWKNLAMDLMTVRQILGFASAGTITLHGFKFIDA